MNILRWKPVLERVGPWLYLGIQRHVACGVYEIGFKPLFRVLYR
jgi:hypothetical protein